MYLWNSIFSLMCKYPSQHIDHQPYYLTCEVCQIMGVSSSSGIDAHIARLISNQMQRFGSHHRLYSPLSHLRLLSPNPLKDTINLTVEAVVAPRKNLSLLCAATSFVCGKLTPQVVSWTLTFFASWCCICQLSCKWARKTWKMPGVRQLDVASSSNLIGLWLFVHVYTHRLTVKVAEVDSTLLRIQRFQGNLFVIFYVLVTFLSWWLTYSRATKGNYHLLSPVPFL